MFSQLQELQDRERECLAMKTVNETQESRHEVECLNKQLEAQKATLERVEMQNVTLTQRLHATLDEMGSVAKERDELRSMEERLTGERDQLEASLKETVTRVSCHFSAIMQLNVLMTLGLRVGNVYNLSQESSCSILHYTHLHSSAKAADSHSPLMGDW